MNLTRQDILAIAKKHNMEYVHETFLMRFVEELIAAEKQKDTTK
jgi:hypothetical protein